MTRISSITGIILAAGTGSRMGKTKQLLPFKDSTLVQIAVSQALKSKLERVILVLGHDAIQIRPLVEHQDLSIVENPDFKSGQASSLKKGLKTVSPDADGVMFLLADQPLISSDLINILIEQWQASPDSIAVPFYKGKRGNPVIFPKPLFGQLKKLSGDTGGRKLFVDHSDLILPVEVADPGVITDIDRPDEYEELLKEDNGI